MKKEIKKLGLMLTLCLALAPAVPAETTPESVEALAPEKCRGMVQIPAGEFFFGDDYAPLGKRKGPVPSMVKTGGYFIDKCEVTWRQYLAFHEAAYGKKWSGGKISPENLDTPVTARTYFIGGAFCKALGKRLPTEQEWEKAARGGTQTLYYWGDEWPGDDNEYEWNIEKYVNQRYYYPVATKRANPYGLYDMLGNVREMTSGNCDKGGSIRLGAWNSRPGKCYRRAADGKAGDLGWRCVKDLPKKNEIEK